MIKKSSRNKILSLIIFIGLMSLLYVTQAEQTIIINPDNGTIQEAIDNASTGDTILLENGTYNGTGNYNIAVNKTVTIKAAPNNDTPIINATGQGRIFNITANNVILNGLTITGGNNIYGGAIHNTGANSSVSNSSFINNTGSFGGAIYNGFAAANFSVSNSSFINNTANYGGAIYNFGAANFSVSNSSFINNTGTNSYGGIIYNNNGANFSVSNSSFINNIATIGGAICNSGANFSVIGCDIVGNIGGGIYNDDGANFSVIGCDIVGNIGGGIYNDDGANATINYNRIVNNTNYGLNNTGTGINADCNWWGTNNISNANITNAIPNSYFVIRLSANDNNYTRNVTVSGSLPVSLAYDMVLNSTNKSDNSSKLPDFNTTIKLTGLSDNSTKAIEPWGTTLTNIGEYNFTAICDNENLNINLTVTHPLYDLSLRNEPSGQVYVGTWIHSTATAINGGEPLPDDYCIFKITAPSGNIHEIGPGVFGVNDWVDCWWQLTEKGTYLVEVWAFDKDGAHVPTAVIFKANNVFLRLVSNDSAGEATASQIITVK